MTSTSACRAILAIIVTVATDSAADVVQATALADDKLRRHVAEKTIVKTIFVPNRILNLIVR